MILRVIFRSCTGVSPAWVTKVSEEEVEVDLNHPLAGRKLVFNIKVERVRKGAKE